LRVPGWARGVSLSINGEAVAVPRDDAGYAVVERVWSKGDTLRLHLPLELRVEATPDDPDLVAVLYGPLVLAADLGPAGAPYELPDPVFVSEGFLDAFEASGAAHFVARGVTRPFDLHFAPFFELRDRNTAVYFRRYTTEAWDRARDAALAARAAEAERNARSADLVILGDDESEAAHDLVHSERSYAVAYRKRPGRDARTGNYFEFTLAATGGDLVLEASYWGGERERDFHILVDGEAVARQTLDGERLGEFFEVRYALPPELTRGRESLRVRFEPVEGHTAGPVFGVRLLPA
jgi:hypothetical protein